jgi:hypothetical protein
MVVAATFVIWAIYLTWSDLRTAKTRVVPVRKDGPGHG